MIDLFVLLNDNAVIIIATVTIAIIYVAIVIKFRSKKAKKHGNKKVNKINK